MLSDAITSARTKIGELIDEAHDLEFIQGRNAEACWEKIFALQELVKLAVAEGENENVELESKMRCYL